ncbi:TPA: hypothetical protein ACIN7K_002093 [Streptococcus agalactiae]
MIINSFDNSRKAIINPEDINSPIKGFPKTVITCFARETFNRILEELPHREIAVNTKFHEEFKSFLDRQAVSYTEGKVWTTDGIYRETVDKMLEHKRNGAICVDMECSAIAALSKFRNINHFQFFYSADNLDAEVWEARSLGNSEDLEKKDKIAYIAMEFAIETF